MIFKNFSSSIPLNGPSHPQLIPRTGKYPQRDRFLATLQKGIYLVTDCSLTEALPVWAFLCCSSLFLFPIALSNAWAYISILISISISLSIYLSIYISSLVAKLCLTLLQPHGLDRLLCPWDFLSKNTGVGCHFLHQGIFPTQGSSLHLLYWQMGSLPLSHLESSYIGTYHWEHDIYIYIIQSIVCHRTYYFYILKSSLELKLSSSLSEKLRGAVGFIIL